MCIRVVERYFVCRCIYYSHAVDSCPAYGRQDHAVRTKEVLVGYSCSRHTPTTNRVPTTVQQPSQDDVTSPDSTAREKHNEMQPPSWRTQLVGHSQKDVQQWEVSEQKDPSLSLEKSHQMLDQLCTTRFKKTSLRYHRRLNVATRIAHGTKGSWVENSHVKDERGLRNEGTENGEEEEGYAGVCQEVPHPPPQTNRLEELAPPARRFSTASLKGTLSELGMPEAEDTPVEVPAPLKWKKNNQLSRIKVEENPTSNLKPGLDATSVMKGPERCDLLTSALPDTTLYVRALYNYHAGDQTHINFHCGDIIRVITKQESGWWDGTANGVRGWFPSNYCTEEIGQSLVRINTQLSSAPTGTEDNVTDKGNVDISIKRTLGVLVDTIIGSIRKISNSPLEWEMWKRTKTGCLSK